MKKFQSGLIYLFFLIPFAAISCHPSKEIDVSQIRLELRTSRFDKALFQLNPANLLEGTNKLRSQYGIFYDDYMTRILSVGSTSDTGYFKNLRVVLRNKDYLELNHDVQQKFPLLTDRDAQLTDAFKHLLYYYPQLKVPAMISFVSGFDDQVVIGDGYIGIDLDMFLGADSRFYPALRESIPQYISRRYTPENIVPRVMEGFIREELYPEPDGNHSLLDHMVYNGKIMYLMDKVLPKTPDSLKIGYTHEQDDWSKKNEADIWSYFIDEQLLYETDYMKIQKYLTEAPFTPGIGDHNESSPKLAVFTGWQIVKHFMDAHPDVTLLQLMGMKDAQELLTKSKYHPG